MKQNRRVWTILAVCLLLVCTLALSALAQGGATEKTVYVGTYSGTDSDGTQEKPYTTLDDAIDAINAAKTANDSITSGKIILIDDVAEVYVKNDYHQLHAATVPLTVTSNDASDRKKIKVGDSTKKRFLCCTTEITFENVIFQQADSSNNVEIWSGKSLTIGENVSFLKSNGAVATSSVWSIRCGFPGASTESVYLEINSGSLCMVHLGNDKGTGDVTAVINKDVKITEFLQCGGTRHGAGNVNATVNGATVNTVYVGGYSDGSGKATATSVDLTMIDATVTALYGGRSNTSNTASTDTGNVKVTLDNTTAGTMTLTNLAASGEKELVLKNFTDWTTTNTLTGWDAVKLENATVFVDAAYAGPAVTADAASLLIVPDSTATLPTVTDNRVLKESEAVVYLDPQETSGKTDVAATMEAAYAKLSDKGGIIVLCSDLKMQYTGEKKAWPTNNGPVTITSKFDGTDYLAAGAKLNLNGTTTSRQLIQFRSVTKFSNMGLYITKANATSAIEFYAGPSLTLGAGMVMTCNNASGAEVPIFSCSSGRFSVRLGDCNSAYAAGVSTFHMHSGTVNYIQGGNNSIPLTGTNTIYVGKNATVIDYIQCGGTGRSVENVVATINGADVSKVYLNGHGSAAMNKLELTVNNTEIETIAYQRETGGSMKEAKVTFSNASIDTLCSVNAQQIEKAKLVLKSGDYSAATENLTGWNVVVNELLDTVYVKGGGAGAKDGTDEDNAVATLEEAYNRVKDGGTIVLCGDLKITANGSIYSLPEKAATITGQDYSPVLTFDNTSNEKLHVQFKKATTLENITINRGEKMAGYPRCLELWTGPELTVGEGMSFTNNGAALSRHSDGQVVVRVGDRTMANTAALPNGEYTQKSGTLSFIQSGNNYHEVTSTTVNLSGTAVVLDNIQCGGTNKKVGTSEVNISGSVQIGDLYVNGYGSASLDSVTINITGGTINNLRAGRSRAQYNDANNAESTGTLGNVTVTIGGTAKVKEIDFWDQNTMTFTGTKKLVMKALAEEFTYNGSFGQWDEVSIEEASAVCYSGTYVAPKSKLVIKDTSKLIVNTCTNNPNNITADEGTGTVTGRHLINYVDAKEVSIAYPGELAHYACPSCGKIYRDADGVNEITDRESIRTYWQCHTDNGSLTGTGDDFSTEMMFTISGGQGIAISGDYMFQCDGSGNCYVYNMLTGRRIGSFELGSYNNGSIASFESEDWVSDEDRQHYAELQQQLDAAKANGASENELKAIEDKMATIRADYQNHANQIMFSSYYYKDTDVFPLLYVTAGNEGAYGKYGYRGHCAVERIVYDEKTGIWSAQCLQRIFFDDRGYETAEINQNNFAFTYQNNTNTGFVNTNGYEKIGWGWPASFVDSDPSNSVTKDKFYLYSARYRTTTSWESSWANTYAQNGFDNFNYADHSAYIITEFNMPAPPSEGGQYDAREVPTPRDIQDQFTTEYRSYVTQGGTMYQGRIYYSYGWNGAYGTAHADSLQVFDIASKKIISRLDLGEDRNGIGHCEPECVAVWNGKIVMSCNGRNPVPSGLWIFGHIELHGETKPTCTEDGTHYTYCSYCGEHLSDTVKVEDKLDHSFTNYVSNNDATCTEDGTKTAVCDRDGCNEKDTVVDTGSKLDHSFTDYKSNGDATCTADGTKTAKCDRCDETDTVKEAAHGHKLTKVAGKAATCTEEGVVEHYTCSVCKKNFSDAEGKTALSTIVIPSCHSVEKVEGKAATTTENGLKEHYGCASCGKVYADAEGKTEVTKDSLIISATSAPTDTGDDFQAWPFVLLMLLSVAGVTVLVIGKKQWFRKNK